MTNPKRVLILCTGNSARSQMAEGVLRHEAGNQYEVFSAGTQPRPLNPLAEDPAAAPGDEAARLAVFRRVRDEIRERLRGFLQ
jgi:protein-tyrosine-phosphatase